MAVWSVECGVFGTLYVLSIVYNIVIVILSVKMSNCHIPTKVGIQQILELFRHFL